MLDKSTQPSDGDVSFKGDGAAQPAARPDAALPSTLKEAVRGAQETGRKAQEKAMFAMPFRARLRARDGMRPKTTLSILSGIDPDTDKFEPGRNDAPPAPRAHVSLVAEGGDTALNQDAPGGSLPGGNSGDGFRPDDEDRGLRSKLGDMSQFAFAGLAVLGLAGLSVMAAESALSGKVTKTAGGDDPSADPYAETASVSVASAPAAAPANAVSIAASDIAAPAASRPWFDYRGVADMLTARKADADRMLAEAAAEKARQQELAGEQARIAIAEAESTRLAAQSAETANAEKTRLATEAADKLRLADAEAARIAELAAAARRDAETREIAARVAEEKRIAEADARRFAEAEAETRRVQEIAEARKVAEARRLAELERERLAAVTAARTEPRRTDSASAPAPMTVAASDLTPPPPASLKPARPRAAYSSTTAPVRADSTYSGTTSLVTGSRAVTRTAPPSYSASTLTVRPLGKPSVQAEPQRVDLFMAERVERTAGSNIDQAQLGSFRSQFVSLLETQTDGTQHTLMTPDGREVKLMFERTAAKEWSKTTVRNIDYRVLDAAAQPVMRYVSDPQPVTVSVMCRDVSYSFPGQERGRFAACKTPDGHWTIARASDQPAQPV